jgi:hypothetical protein
VVGLWIEIVAERVADMYELGRKEQAVGTKVSNLIEVHYMRPTSFPLVSPGEAVICGYNQGLGEHLFVCESLDDLQELWDRYATGYTLGCTLTIAWYVGDVLSRATETSR